MSDYLHIDGDTRAGTIGGTLVVVLLNIFEHNVLHSALLAFVGATVSFFASFGWKYLLRYFQNRLQKKKKIKNDSGLS